MPKTIQLLCIALVVLPSLVLAQITVSSSDILGLVGQSQTVEFDTSGSVTVNVGASGANQTWNFTSVNVQGFTTTQAFLAPAGTPFAADFPTANFVTSFSDFSGGGGFEAVVYEYAEVTSSGFSNLGGGIDVPSLDTTFVSFRAQDVAPLPLAFNASWTSTEGDTSGDPATFAIISSDTTTNVVDAWGQVILPIGTFDCLRVRSDSRSASKTVVNNMVISSDDYTTISYTWISRSDFVVASAESQENETNPNFTDAAVFQRIGSSTTSVEDPGQGNEVPANFRLGQNYPNPFNPETIIDYQIRESGQVELAVYNLLGQKIKTLVNQKLDSGTYQTRWDGRDDFGRQVAGGLYFYQLQTERFTETRRMVLLQ